MPNDYPVGQDTNHPYSPSFDKFIVGVSIVRSSPESYQFIFNDGDRTKAVDLTYKSSQWEDVIIPKGKMIQKVQIMFDKTDSCIYGL